MAVVIRMKRTGRRHRPCYRISVADSRNKRDGNTIETIGLYDPIAPRPEMRLELNVERAVHWLSRGAKPSETVDSIFKQAAVYADRPPAAKRDRSGRKRKTATKARRAASKEARGKAKAARREERVQKKKAAAQAASTGE